jgi:hypothetical protein
MNEPALSSSAGEECSESGSQIVGWWFALDSGWKAVLLGVVAIGCSFAVGVV